jgi:hypothetical protein
MCVCMCVSFSWGPVLTRVNEIKSVKNVKTMSLLALNTEWRDRTENNTPTTLSSKLPF